ncbi:MAG: hypothetical protein LBS45_09295 [Synergistaceae bacterium]|nr:hypothetical protein [Synergistaceae bacterium]
MARKVGNLCRDRFLLVSVILFAVSTLSISCLSFTYCARPDFISGSPASPVVFGAGEAQGSGGTFLGAAGPFNIDLFAGVSPSYDYEKTASRHQSEIDRRTVREVESASFHVLRHTLKAYETEYLRSDVSRRAGSSSDVRDWRKAIERILPS